MSVSPGCFGFPSIFSFKSEVCSACSHNQECEREVESKLRSESDKPHVRVALKAHESARSAFSGAMSSGAQQTREKPLVGLVKRSRAAVKYVPTDEQEAALKNAPKKVARIAMTLWGRGFEYKGSNPFNVTLNKTFHAAFETIAKTGRVTKKELRMGIADLLNWSESSAYSEVSVVWSLFPILGITRESESGTELDLIDFELPNSADYNSPLA